MERTEINTQQLRQVLSNFSTELELSFLERRSRNNSHKANPLEELSDVVKELTDRERQLQASVGIAKMLLDNNELLSQELETVREKKREKSHCIRSLKQEIDTLREDFIAADRKYIQLNEALVQAEEQLLTYRSENGRLLRDLKGKTETQSDKDDFYFEEAKLQFAQEIGALRKARAEDSRSLKEATCKVYELEEANKRLEEDSTRAKKETERLKIALKDTGEELQMVTDRLVHSEKSLQSTQISYSKAMGQLKGLEEELVLAQQTSENSWVREFEEPEGTLFDELQSLDYEDSTIGSESERKRKPRISEPLGTVHLPSRGKKDVCEEYFMLAAQSIKLNSSYMDAISSVPMNMLYKKALALEIPFHKWYDWIKDELNSVYIHILYQRDLKSKAPSKKLLG